jgi:hypothetical protein
MKQCLRCVCMSVFMHNNQATSGCLEFQPGEAVKHITVTILDNNVPEPDVTFKVYLTRVSRWQHRCPAEGGRQAASPV